MPSSIYCGVCQYFENHASKFCAKSKEVDPIKPISLRQIYKCFDSGYQCESEGRVKGILLPYESLSFTSVVGSGK